MSGKISCGGGALLSTKTEYRDDRDGAQKKNHEKPAQHNQSSWTMVMCSPPVCSSNWRTPASVNRGSRASIARKNPSLVTRLNRSQLNIGWYQRGNPFMPSIEKNAANAPKSTVSSNMMGKNAGTVQKFQGLPCTSS